MSGFPPHRRTTHHAGGAFRAPLPLRTTPDTRSARVAQETSPMIRIALALLALVGAVFPAQRGNAQGTQAAFPSRIVRVVVPYPAGGGTDILARFLAEHLARKWGH